MKTVLFSTFLLVAAIPEEVFGMDEEEMDETEGHEHNAHNAARKKFVRQQSRSMSTTSAGSGPRSPLKSQVSLTKKMEADRVCKLPENKNKDHKLIEDEKAETGSVSKNICL